MLRFQFLWCVDASACLLGNIWKSLMWFINIHIKSNLQAKKPQTVFEAVVWRHRNKWVCNSNTKILQYFWWHTSLCLHKYINTEGKPYPAWSGHRLHSNWQYHVARFSFSSQDCFWSWHKNTSSHNFLPKAAVLSYYTTSSLIGREQGRSYLSSPFSRKQHKLPRKPRVPPSLTQGNQTTTLIAAVLLKPGKSPGTDRTETMPSSEQM